MTNTSYRVAPNPNAARWIERCAPRLAELSEEDWPLVLGFVEYLKRRREILRQKNRVAEIQVAARRRAKELESIPREQIAAHFDQLVEEIRQSVIVKDTAIEGDWQSD